MTPRRIDPRPIQALLERLWPAREGRPAFVEGLVLGAAVGAALAGSTLWSRIRTRRRPHREEPAEPD